MLKKLLALAVSVFMYNGTVNLADLAAVQSFVNNGAGASSFSNVMKCLADVDNDGDVDSNDVNIISNSLLGSRAS